MSNEDYRYQCNSAAPRAAIIACTKIIDDEREDADGRMMALQNRGIYYQAVGDLDRSIADYIAVLHFSAGRTNADFGLVVALDPRMGSAYMNRGVAYMSKSAAFLNRGQALQESGYTDRTIADFDQVIRNQPDPIQSYLQRAFLRQRRGDTAGAVEEYSQAIALDPAAAEALRGRGYARLNQHDYDRAIAELTAAIALNPKDALAFRFRSSAYAAKKESKLAHNDEFMARQLDPGAR